MLLDDMEKSYPKGSGEVTFLPEPERQERKYTVLSVDDHLVEPPTTFEGRIPSKFADRAPRVVTVESGGEAWLYDGELLPNVGMNAVAGRPIREYNQEPARFEDMRRGAWDPDARVADMDLDGTYASLCFPSFLAGFGGARLQLSTEDQELSWAVLQAWNDWHIEEWVGSHPDRLIPCALTWLHDPIRGAAEIRRNADRGVHALTFPEAPHNFGFPSIHNDYWDPIFEACVETDTVLCLHVGSGSSIVSTSEDAPYGVAGVLFGTCAMITGVDWAYSRVPVTFPEIKIVLSEGGIGWVPAVIDRLEHCSTHSAWWREESSPLEMFRRNFWFCMLDDPSAIRVRDVIGVDRIMFEVDYPHADSSWPATQKLIDRQLGSLPQSDIERITWKNAAELFQHEVPVSVQRDPNSF
jgi:predicted TIM-barrel fold metal-dependent hydrolase